MISISIIGAGWLGKPLAQHLSNHHGVYVSKSTPEQAKALQADGWNACAFRLGEPLPAMLANNNVAVINVPPKLRGAATAEDAERFTERMLNLIQEFMSSAVSPNSKNSNKNIVFVSTTAVYGDATGDITETTPVNPQTLSAKAHVNIERYLHSQFPEQATVLRLSGLVSVDRHPVRSLVKRSQAGAKPLANPLQVVNLIHRTDVITAISTIIEQQYFGKTLHLACPDHPTRNDYYCWAAHQCGLPAPQFETVQQTLEEQETQGKIINAHATLQQLNLTLQAPSPYNMFAVESQAEK